jgi:hypothetical protein
MTFVFWCLICGAVCTGLLCVIDVLIMLCSERVLPPEGWYPVDGREQYWTGTQWGSHPPMPEPMPEPYEPR